MAPAMQGKAHSGMPDRPRSRRRAPARLATGRVCVLRARRMNGWGKSTGSDAIWPPPPPPRPEARPAPHSTPPTRSAGSEHEIAFACVAAPLRPTTAGIDPGRPESRHRVFSFWSRRRRLTNTAPSAEPLVRPVRRPRRRPPRGNGNGKGQPSKQQSRFRGALQAAACNASCSEPCAAPSRAAGCLAAALCD